jgi:hypothetical protein
MPPPSKPMKLTGDDRILSLSQNIGQRQIITAAVPDSKKVLQACTDIPQTLDQASHQTPNTDHSFPEPHSQPQHALGDLHWSERLNKGLPGDLFRYVQQQDLLEPHVRSTPYEPDMAWSGYSVSTGTEPFNPETFHYQASGEPEVFVPMSPEANLSPMDLAYSTLSSYTPNSWMDNQDYGLRHMEPG